MATYSGTPKTWTAGETLLASDFNAEIRDPIAALSGAWTPWTPTLSQGASSNISKTVTRADYIRIGSFVVFQVWVSATGSGTAGSGIYLSAPVQCKDTGAQPCGSGWYRRSPTQYNGVAYVATGGATLGLAVGSIETTGQLGTAPAITVTSGDSYQLFGIYEAA